MHPFLILLMLSPVLLVICIGVLGWLIAKAFNLNTKGQAVLTLISCVVGFAVVYFGLGFNAL